LNHLWQRFLLASALVVGLLIGVGASVFGYSNLARVDVHWSVFHLSGVPLWAVALVPLALVLIAGTLYHWLDGLHHFTEHMRHRRRVHELEAEVASLRARLDLVLEMPDQSTVKLPDQKKGELFGIADALQGGSRLKVNCEDGKSRMARIPGKLKRRMWIREGDLVIVRPWDFQNDKCDVVFRYTKTQASYLARRGMIPKQINIF